MAFTYTDTLLTARDKIRHSIRDTVSARGILPEGKNFSDNEIAFELTLNSDWRYVVPKLLNVAANGWSARAAMLEEGDAHMEDTRSVATRLREQAKEWRNTVLAEAEGAGLISWYEDAARPFPFYETGVSGV